MALFDIGNPAVPVGDDSLPVRPAIRLGKYGIGNPPPDAGPVGGAAATTPAGVTPNSVIRPAVQQPPQAPQMDTAELQRRQAAVDQYAQPIDRTDPKYKLSLGQRLLRIGSDVLSGGIPGALRDAVDPTARGYYGKGAVNSQYGIDEATRAKNEAAAQTSLKNFDTGYDEQLKGYKENLESYKQGALATERQAKADKYDNTVDQSTLAPDDSAHPEGTWHGTTPGGQQKTGLPAPKWWQQQNAKEDTSDKLQAQLDARTKAADQLKLKGADRTYYIANGKLREPNPDADARRRDTDQRHQDSQDSLNFQRYQTNLAKYNAKKADIVQREKDAYANLERQSRDKDGKIKDPAALESGKATLQKQFADEYNALGAEPQEYQPKGKAAPNVPSQNGKSNRGDFGPAPKGSKEGRTGTLPDGTAVIVKGGRIVRNQTGKTRQ